MNLLNIFLVCYLFAVALFGNEKTINVAVGLDKPPFVFGKTFAKGIEPDLIMAAFKEVGFKVKIIQKPKNFLEAILHTKNSIDAVATISKRDDELFYSDDFTVYENYCVTRKKDNLKINSIEDLTVIKFVSWKNSYNDLGDKFYKLFNPIDGLYKSSYNDNPSQLDDVKMFFSKKVDAILIDKTIFKWYKNHLKNYQEYDFHAIFPKKKIYPVAFRDKNLRDIFNKGLRKIKEKGIYDQIINFYETQNIKELLDFTTLLSEICGKYLFENKTKQLKELISLFFTHEDIMAIMIENKLYKTPKLNY